MAEKVKLEVELKSNLDKLTEATKGLKLNEGQAKRFETQRNAAQLALNVNDLKGFQKAFNNLVDLFKQAAAATGKVSDEIKKMTERQAALNKEINALKDKKATLETHRTAKGELSKEGREVVSKQSKYLGKVKDSSGAQVTAENAQRFVEALGEYADNLRKLTKEQVLKAKGNPGVDITDVNAAKAAVQYSREESRYLNTLPRQISDVGAEIGTKELESTELAKEIEKLNTAAKEGADGIEKLYVEISKLANETNAAITKEKGEKIKSGASGQAVNVSKDIPDVATTEKQSSALGKAFKQFTLYNIALKAVKTAAREATQTIKELDKYLTEQAMVTGLTREQTYGLVESYQTLAASCGATTKEIAQVSTEYMKQGKSIQESLILTEAAVKAAKVARVSVGDSVNYLTTALNGFRLSAEDAMKVSDKFAAVAASSATDYDELAIALSKVASQANLAGMSIDYTTALLTKGLETTREAPETMGTALKTIIARMRELGDYGETLEDGTDINNVETQLRYVDIALRDQQGELRSTEDVLDELGKKWDTLNKNQQAAIAKALAGTRQQSRLIAMMEDYERVTELQEISQRSAGATAAQAGVYLEGMEAAMNKIQVAWEKIVMTLTDSEVVIGIFEFIGDALNKIGDFLSTDFGLVTTLTVAGTLGATILGNKIKENKLSKLQAEYALQQNILENQKNTEIQKQVVAEKKQAILKIKDNIREKENLITQKKQGIELAKQVKTRALASGKAALAAKMTKDIADAQSSITKTEEEIAQLKTVDLANANAELEQEEAKLTIYEKQGDQLKAQESLIGSIFSGLSAFTGPLFAVIAAWKMISGLITIIRGKQAALHKQTMLEAAKENAVNAKKSAGKIISQLGWWGIPLAIAVAAALADVGLRINAAVKKSKENTADQAAEDINKLGQEIYKLNEKANALDKIGDSFDDLDSKIIKTSKDIEEMNSLLDQAADKLSDEEKAVYNGLTTNKHKRDYLEKVEQQARTDANTKRNEIRSRIKGLGGSERAKLLSSNTTNADYLAVQSQIYAIANNELYEHIDALKNSTDITDEQASAVEGLTQSILEQMDVQTAWDYAQDDSGTKIKNLANKIKDLRIEIKDLDGETKKIDVAQVLGSDDASLKERVKAYEAVLDTLGGKEEQAFKEAYSQYDYFTQFSDESLDFLDKKGLGGEKLNDLASAWKKIQKAGVEEMTEEVWRGSLDEYINVLAETNGDVEKATREVFGEFLDGTEDNMNAFISAYGDIVQVGVLNMGQTMDKVKNSVNNFYNKALEWNTMSESDRAEFIQDNAELFADDLSTQGINEGQELLRAFESGNYALIESALKSNKVLQERMADQREKVRQELLIEEARVGEDRNEAYIAELKRYEEYLNDTENLFKASLEIRLEQEKAQLDEYRSYLEDQQSALEDSLNKRKEAYEKYFNEINKEEEDEDYEKQADLLVSNLSKLGSTSNASAAQQTQELEQQLKELEEERLKELRERAQEAILENMDDELSQINEKFDKLLESNQALLAAMQGELNNPLEFMTELVSNKIESGATALEVQDYINSLQTTYGSVLGSDVNWDDIKVREENNQLFLNVNGTEIALNTSNEQNLYQAIMKALREIGLR